MKKRYVQKVLRERLKDYRLIVVSNREPYIHRWKDGEIECLRPASGLTIALDPVAQICGGVWIAHGSGSADRATVDENGKVWVPPQSPSYELKRIWLSKEQEEGYYFGFANQALWPLCHITYTRPLFRELEWNHYRRVNEIFAKAVLEEIGSEQPMVFVQDYHLALLPKLIKERRPDAITLQFWHIPWPNPEAFRICPWKKEILEGLLGNNVLGFHIRHHCNNFIDTVALELEARPDRERCAIAYKDRMTYIRHFPISVDFDAIAERAASKEVEEEAEKLKASYHLWDKVVGIGVDRLDYTKGIPEKFRAIDLFLERNPRYRERFVYIQVGAPSRESIPSYQHLSNEVEGLVTVINRKHGTEHWNPILFLRSHIPFSSLLAFYRIAHFCIVSSLHDGMNLVAKEYVSSKVDDQGVLILSQFTGAARELDAALLINPYGIEEFAGTIERALEMPPEEATQRMKRLRDTVKERNIYRWADRILTKALQVSQSR